jgi:hypothetical protein
MNDYLAKQLAVLKPHYGHSDEEILRVLVNDFFNHHWDELTRGPCAGKLAAFTTWAAKQ